MMNTKQLSLVLATLIMILVPAMAAIAADPVAELTAMTGRVDILRGGQLPSEKAKVGSQLLVGDFIRTKSKSTAEVLFADGNKIKIEPRSRVDISNYSTRNDQRTLNLARGKIEAVVIPADQQSAKARPKRFEIETPNAVAGVRGTTLVVAFQDNITAIHVVAASSGRSVYSISRHFPDRIVNVPVGGMMWVRNQGPPTLMPPSSDLGFAILAGLGNLGELQVLVDSLLAGGELPPIFSEAFPEALGVKVGVVDMAGTQFLSNHIFDVSMTANFIALSADTAPVLWNSDNLTLSWSSISVPSSFDPSLQSVDLTGNGPVGQADAVFTVSNWDTNSGAWSATVTSGLGTVPNGSSFGFSGTASGVGAVSDSAGSTTGTAIGNAVDNSGG
jgi:hypothetical protein